MVSVFICADEQTANTETKIADKTALIFVEEKLRPKALYTRDEIHTPLDA
jgi:hypothetical protein